MTIMDDKFSAQCISKKGKSFKFDETALFELSTVSSDTLESAVGMVVVDSGSGSCHGNNIGSGNIGSLIGSGSGNISGIGGVSGNITNISRCGSGGGNGNGNGIASTRLNLSGINGINNHDSKLFGVNNGLNNGLSNKINDHNNKVFGMNNGTNDHTTSKLFGMKDNCSTILTSTRINDHSNNHSNNKLYGIHGKSYEIPLLFDHHNYPNCIGPDVQRYRGIEGSSKHNDIESLESFKRRKINETIIVYPFFGSSILIPKILALRILVFLDSKDLYSMSCVGRLWSKTTFDDALWESDSD